MLIISQVYVPDPASVGQHVHDAAAEMARRGWRVVVYASARGYDDPSRKYPRREVLDGVEVRRLPLSSFGKGSIKARLLGQSIFLLQVMLRAVWLRRLSGILVSTSPPMASIAAVFIATLRRVPVTFWAMDINPDQLIAMGQTTPNSLPARVFDWLNRMILRRARAVVALDRFMAERLERKVPVGSRMHVMPPWPHDDHLESVPHADNPFRHEHGLDGKFVLMYSGNISPSHPVTTILEAAKRLADDPSLVFLFIGGGLGKRRIDAFIEREGLSNVRTLPYQPLDLIRYSLSAADAHLVAVGDAMVGIVHPCKVYGAMAVARPILLLGPRQSHVGEMLERFDIGWQVDHDDVDGAVDRLRQMRQTEESVLAAMGQRARSAVEAQFSMKTLRGRFCDVLEQTMPPSRGDEAVSAETVAGRSSP